jgi:hypothetical protein
MAVLLGGEQRGGSGGIPLTPLYMNIIEFIHVAIIMLLPTKLTALEL